MSTQPQEPPAEHGPQSSPHSPAVDPWKGLRGIMAGTLVLEAIVVALALPVVGTLGGGLTTVSGALVAALAVAMVVASGLQRRRWGLGFALALQALMIVSGLLVSALGILGVVFALVWVYLLYLRAEVARRMAEGSLPSQQRPASLQPPDGQQRPDGQWGDEGHRHQP